MCSRGAKIVTLALLGVQPWTVSSKGNQLPEVESVLTKATGKMQDFAAEASAMQARVAQKQKASREALALQKSTYEQKLESQAVNNSAIEAATVKIQQHITELESGNAGLKSETDHLQNDNMAMRGVIEAIQDKVKAAKLFLADSLRLTDDSKVDELNVLEPPAPKPTLEHFLEVAKSDSAPSFFQVSVRRDSPSETPEDLVQVLSNSLADISAAEKEGEAELKAHFLAALETGNAQHEKLIATQTTLNETAASLEARQAELKTAKTHLGATRQQLQQRLHGLRVFARKVDASTYSALKSVEPAHSVPATTLPTASTAALVNKASTVAKTTSAPTSTSPPAQAKAALAKKSAKVSKVSLMAKPAPVVKVGMAAKRPEGKGRKPAAKASLAQTKKQGQQGPPKKASLGEHEGSRSGNPALKEPTANAVVEKEVASSKSWFRFPWQH